MTTEIAKRTRLRWVDETTVPAGIERVFPLLCPVREYEWIPYWKCEMVHSESGVAEDGCVFQTDFPGEGKMTWVVSLYEPPVRIEFSCVAPGLFVMRLKLRLTAAAPDLTTIQWKREFLSLSEAGDHLLVENKTDAARHDLMARVEQYLRQYFERAA